MNFFTKLRTKHWFVIVVGIPTLISILYYGLIASDQYYSESRFVVKSVNQKSSQMSTLANLVQTTGLSGGQEQTNEILDYVRSRNALRDVQKRIGFSQRYNIAEADFLSVYPSMFREAKFENLYRYYGDVVNADLDKETGTAVLTVRAFTAEDAQKINNTLLDLSENLVNRLNARAEKRAISEAMSQVETASRRAVEARLAMGQYRNAQALIDPAEQAVGVLDITSKLITEEAGLKSQLQLMERTAPSHPAIPALRSRIAALNTQISAQTGRAVGTREGIASKIGGYENLAFEQELAEKNLAINMGSLEQARAEAAKQKFYLERIVEPNAPDVALYPSRFRSILVVAGSALCLFLVGWMLTVGILEHAPEED
ncbi:capsule biosynthesis protein [Qipengyuania sp. NPDC077410]|uniref:capsule biosynthesis protein n=1 Tax=Qipengyuania sp. NPDC077410 TaxID=3364496 RepID=UPI0037C64872